MKKGIVGFIKKNSSTILTCAGAAGVIATSVMAAKATPKAMRLIETAKADKGEELSKNETIKIAAPVYIPAAVMGTLTISCIFGANILNKHEQAAITSAYALVSNAYREYKNKTREICGEETHKKILESIAAEKSKNVYIYAGSYVGSTSLVFEDSGEEERLFYDSFSGRYFQSTISKVLIAEYHINRNYVLGASPSLNEFYEFLGLETTEFGESVGWHDECYDSGVYWIDFDHSKAELEDGLECYIIDMIFPPIPYEAKET